jgi:hypothetical protein
LQTPAVRLTGFSFFASLVVKNFTTKYFTGAGRFESGEFELAAGFDTSVNRTEILKSPAPLYPAYKMAKLIGRFGIMCM